MTTWCAHFLLADDCGAPEPPHLSHKTCPDTHHRHRLAQDPPGRTCSWIIRLLKYFWGFDKKGPEWAEHAHFRISPPQPLSVSPDLLHYFASLRHLLHTNSNVILRSLFRIHVQYLYPPIIRIFLRPVYKINVQKNAHPLISRPFEPLQRLICSGIVIYSYILTIQRISLHFGRHLVPHDHLCFPYVLVISLRSFFSFRQANTPAAFWPTDPVAKTPGSRWVAPPLIAPRLDVIL